MAKGKADKIKIAVREDDALRAFLQTPPERKKPKKKVGKKRK